MISIGMIGADSTHTESYASLMNLPGAPFGERARVVKLWGEDAAQAQEKARKCQIPQVVSDPAAAMQGVDLVMICNRYGDDHVAPARLALAAGMPTFVDKPFANDFAAVQELAHLASERKVPVISCSAVRYVPEMLELSNRLSAFGSLSCAIASGQASGDFPNPRAKHPYFYGIHPVEMLHTLLGGGAEAVTTRRTPLCDSALVHYADGRQGIVNLLQKSPSLYHGVVYGEKGWAQVEIGDSPNFYSGTLDKILETAETGHSPLPLSATIEVMAILAALLRSADEGGKTIRLKELA